MIDQEIIERWAGYIIPAVFKAEEKLIQEHPEWKERLRNITKENAEQLAKEYCIAVATEIVTNAEEADSKC